MLPVPAPLPANDSRQNSSSPEVNDTVAVSLDAGTQRVGYENCLRIAPVHSDDTLPPPASGTRIDSYIVHEKLGEGASCHVFRGWDQNRLEHVALKLINWANVHDTSAAITQLRVEALALARVNHPSIVRFLDFGLGARWPYLVTEYIPGAPLGGLLRAGGALVTVDAGPRTGEALAIMQRHEVDLGPGGAARYDPVSRRGVDSSTPGAMTDRRRHADPTYAGPERRLLGV